MGQEKMMSSHNKMNDGAKKKWLFGTEEDDIGSIHDKLWYKQGDFWDRRSWCWVIMSGTIGQNQVTFGTGGDKITS